MNVERFESLRFHKYLLKHKKYFVLMILLGYLLIPFGVLNPYLSKLMIDKAYANQDLEFFILLLLIGAVAFFIKIMLEIVHKILEQYIQREILFDITFDFFKHLQSLPILFFKQRTIGEIVYKVNQDIREVSNYVFSITTSILNTLPNLIIRFFIVFYLNWRFALVISVLAVFSYFHTYIFAKKLRDMQKEITKNSQNIFSKLYEVFNNINLVKNLGREDEEINKYKKNLIKSKFYRKKQENLSNINQTSRNLLNTGIMAIISSYAGYQVISGEMTLGSFTAILMYSNQLFPLFKSLGDLYERIKVNSVHRKRVVNLFNTRNSIIDSRGSKEHKIKGRITFEDVSFSYKNGDNVLKGISFDIKAGEKVGIVGASGSGKSTLFGLVLRLFDCSKGRIMIDGIDIKDIKLRCLREQMSISMQNTLLWKDTVKNNILYGKKGGGTKNFNKAVKIALVDEFAKTLDKRYDTVINEKANNISDGQKQRISVARAVISKPKILVLDESMSNLDSRVEDKIMDNILKEFRGSTILLTSHRLSSVLRMDKIFFIQRNDKIDTGTHEELIKKNEEYVELFGSQVNRMDIYKRMI